MIPDTFRAAQRRMQEMRDAARTRSAGPTPDKHHPDEHASPNGEDS